MSSSSSSSSSSVSTRAAQLTVRDVIKLREPHRWIVDESESVFNATAKMVKERVGALLVARKGKPVGICTERDYLTKIIHEGRTSRDTKVGDIATKDKDLIVASLDDSIEDCLNAMGSNNIRHLPVADQVVGEIVGIISIRDVAKALASDREKALLKLHDLASSKAPIHDG